MKKPTKNAAQTRGKKVSSLKTLKPKKASSAELRQVVGGQGIPKKGGGPT